MTPTTNKVLAGLLILSLSANVLIGGFMLGRWSMGAHGGHGTMHWGGWRGHMAMGRVFDSEETRDKVIGLWRERRERMRPHMVAIDEAREDVQDALKARPYDRVAYGAALDRMRDQMAVMMDEMHGFMLVAGDQLGEEEREAVAEWLEHRRGSGWGHGERRGFWHRLFHDDDDDDDDERD